MERRDAIRYTVLFMGASLSSGTLAAILAGCKVDTSEEWLPSFLSQSEAEFINELGETMLPRTNTPGAKDAQVVRFIDLIRPLRFTTEENHQFKTGLSDFMKQSKTDLNDDFIKASAERKLEWVTTVDRNAYELQSKQSDLESAERPFYLSLKEQILAGYFLSEVVATQYFAFDPIPGKYLACIPYQEIGKDWAL